MPVCVGGTDFDTWWCRHFEVIRIGDRHYEARSACFTPMRTPTILGRADGYPVVALGPMASVHVSALERFGLQCGRCTRSQPPAWGGKNAWHMAEPGALVVPYIILRLVSVSRPQ